VSLLNACAEIRASLGMSAGTAGSSRIVDEDTIV
jgi:hypothetical protein